MVEGYRRVAVPSPEVMTHGACPSTPASRRSPSPKWEDSRLGDIEAPRQRIERIVDHCADRARAKLLGSSSAAAAVSLLVSGSIRIQPALLLTTVMFETSKPIWPSGALVFPLQVL